MSDVRGIMVFYVSIFHKKCQYFLAVITGQYELWISLWDVNVGGMFLILKFNTLHRANVLKLRIENISPISTSYTRCLLMLDPYDWHCSINQCTDTVRHDLFSLWNKSQSLNFGGGGESCLTANTLVFHFCHWWLIGTTFNPNKILQRQKGTDWPSLTIYP